MASSKLRIVILSAAKDLLFASAGRKQVLRSAQNDKLKREKNLCLDGRSSHPYVVRADANAGIRTTS